MRVPRQRLSQQTKVVCPFIYSVVRLEGDAAFGLFRCLMFCSLPRVVHTGNAKHLSETKVLALLKANPGAAMSPTSNGWLPLHFICRYAIFDMQRLQMLPRLIRRLRIAAPRWLLDVVFSTFEFGFLYFPVVRRLSALGTGRH